THRSVGRRHHPNYSDATITDVPVLVLDGPRNSLATRVAFSHDGKRIAAGCDGPKPALSIWDSGTGQTLLTIHQWSILDVAFSPDGKFLASSAHDDHAMIFD